MNIGKAVKYFRTEKAEKRKNSTVARRADLALSSEFTEGCFAVAYQYAQDIADRYKSEIITDKFLNTINLLRKGVLCKLSTYRTLEKLLTEQTVVDFAIEQHAFGQVRVSSEL